MRLQAVDFDRYRTRGALDDEARRECWRALLFDDLERIEMAAAVLHQAKVRGRAGITTPALEAAYYALRARLGTAAMEVVHELQTGWYEALADKVRHDREALGIGHAAAENSTFWSAIHGHFPQRVRDFELAGHDIPDFAVEDATAADEALPERQRFEIQARRIEQWLRAALPAGWSLERVRLCPAFAIADGRARVSVRTPEAGSRSGSGLLVVVEAGTLAAAIQLRPPVARGFVRKVLARAEDPARVLFPEPGNRPGAGRDYGFTGVLAAMVGREAEQADRLHAGGDAGESDRVQATSLVALATYLPRLHRAGPDARARLAARLPALVADADWSDVRVLALAIASAVLRDGPGDALYRSIHAASPEIPSPADLEFLVRAADALRLEEEPRASRRALAREAVALIECESPGPFFAAAVRRWLAPAPDGWAAADLDPLIAVCKARDRAGRLPEALIHLGPVVAALADRGPKLEPFLRELAALVDTHWVRRTRDEPAGAFRLAVLLAFAELVGQAGENIWSRESLNDLWACCPRDTTRQAPSLPASFDAVGRAWLLGREDPAARSAYLVDVTVSTLERHAACPDPGALDQHAAWLRQRRADLAVYHAAARRRVARLVGEFNGDPISLARDLHAIASLGPARAGRPDLTRLADAVALRPRAAPLELGWDLAAAWDEIAVAACTDPGVSWPAELARWLMTGLLRGRPGEVSLWAEQLNRSELGDLASEPWDQVLAGFEARVAAGLAADSDFEALDELVRWLEVRKQPVDPFRRAQQSIESDPRAREDPIAARLALAAALHRGSLPRWAAPSADCLVPGAPSQRVVARAWIIGAAWIAAAASFACAIALWNAWLSNRARPTRVNPPPSVVAAPSAPPAPPRLLETNTLLTANLSSVRKDKVRLELRREGDRYLPIDLVVFHPDVRSSQSTLYVASTETTREQYKFVMDELPPAVEDADGLQFPATNVTWEQARMFCERVDAALGREDEVVRLPLESEWRSLAGPKPPENLEHIAVYGNKEAKAPAQVKTKLAYPDGIYDLRGNVWEWLWPDRDSSLGPAGGSQSTLRVALGGSWVDAADQLETEFRLVHNGSYAMIGFRIVVIPAGK